MTSTLGTSDQTAPLTGPPGGAPGEVVALRPGTPVVARSPGVLQVGIDEPSVRLPDEPDVRGLLDLLARPGGTPAPVPDLSPPAAEALAHLEQAGLVLRMPAGGRVADRLDVVLRAQFGPDAVRRRARRDEASIAVRADSAADLVLDPLLTRAGLRRVPLTDLDATAHLLVATGPVDRELLDPLVRGSVPHLVVSGAASVRRLGPFVEPGRTACLRCVDAHESLRDPRRALVLAQAARAAAERPPPVDAIAEQMVLAWAVRDLLRYAEGDEPSTWSTTIDLGPTAAPALTRWGRHPECGCSWDALTLMP